MNPLSRIWRNLRHPAEAAAAAVADAAAAEELAARLQAAGIARLVCRTADESPLVVAIKAGHNAENHNHNDIGSFILRVGHETYLSDPGPGHYDRDPRDRRCDVRVHGRRDPGRRRVFDAAPFMPLRRSESST